MVKQNSRKKSGKYRIAIIGTGNVATHFVHKLSSKFDIVQACCRKKKSATEFRKNFRIPCVTSVEELTENADIYILAVPDEAIPEISSKIKLNNKLVLHTSGSTEMTVLFNISNRCGVLYPLQTFSKNAMVINTNFPVLIEAANKRDLKIIEKLAREISEHVVYCSSHDRLILHIAAVFACNFTNYMYSVAEKLLQQKTEFPFSFFYSLILETSQRIIFNSPSEVQTGPAKRKDLVTIKKHLDFLKQNKKFHDIYNLITKSIMAQYS